MTKIKNNERKALFRAQLRKLQKIWRKLWAIS